MNEDRAGGHTFQAENKNQTQTEHLAEMGESKHPLLFDTKSCNHMKPWRLVSSFGHQGPGSKFKATNIGFCQDWVPSPPLYLFVYLFSYNLTLPPDSQLEFEPLVALTEFSVF